MSRNIEDLSVFIRLLAKDAVEEMRKDQKLKDMGVSGIFISETKRELSTQMAYYSRGRMAVKDVKKMYSAAGLYAISDDEAKVPNTQTLNSKHIEGKAIDLYPMINGVVIWSPSPEIWQRMGEIGKKHGLEWGGDWDGWKDYPHFQVE